MSNVRGLYPPLYGATPSGGGGGGGQHIQVDALPEASLQYKDKIVQYVGATTDTLTNGYFYKCVEHTETAGETITVTYSWDNIEVMPVSSGGKVAIATATADGSTTYSAICNTLATTIQNVIAPEKTYIMGLKNGADYQFYNCVEINNSAMLFESNLFTVSSTGAGTINNSHFVLSYNGNSKYFYNGTAQGSTSNPSNGTVFTIYEL